MGFCLGVVAIQVLSNEKCYLPGLGDLGIKIVVKNLLIPAGLTH